MFSRYHGVAVTASTIYNLFAWRVMPPKEIGARLTIGRRKLWFGSPQYLIATSIERPARVVREADRHAMNDMSFIRLFADDVNLQCSLPHK